MVFVKPDAPGNAGGNPPAAASPRASHRHFCVAHLSDLHLFDPGHMRAGDFLSKRALSYLSWLLNRQHRHRIDFLPGLQQTLADEAVDHIVVTGDLTHAGHVPDFEAAANLLVQLGGPDRITLIPGNHDACVAMPWLDDAFSLKAYVSSDHSEAEARDSSASLKTAPILRRRRQMAIIGLSTARPTPPFLATGALGPEQLQRLEQILEQTSTEGLFRMILVHHPPVPGAVNRRRRLTDQQAFAAIVRRKGAELILHGHTHRFSEAALEGPRGMVPVLGVPPVTALSAKIRKRAGFHIYRIHPADGRWTADLTAYRFSRSREAFLPDENRPLSIPGPRAAGTAHGA